MTTRNAVVLITGAANGIGRALAHLLSAQGYAIAALDRSQEGLQTLGHELEQQKRRIAWAAADVTEPELLQSAVRTLEASLGPIEILIANAGVAVETSGVRYNVEDMNRIIQVNLIGVSNSIGAVLPGMIQRKAGHLVAISSIASFRGLPRMLGYCASKAGVNAIMDGLRVELLPLGIHVTTVCPGWVRTALTEQLKGHLEHLINVDVAAQEIAYAFQHKLPFYTFPRPMRWRMQLLSAFPRSWQDRYIRRVMNRIRMIQRNRSPG